MSFQISNVNTCVNVQIINCGSAHGQWSLVHLMLKIGIMVLSMDIFAYMTRFAVTSMVIENGNWVIKTTQRIHIKNVQSISMANRIQHFIIDALLLATFTQFDGKKQTTIELKKAKLPIVAFCHLKWALVAFSPGFHYVLLSIWLLGHLLCCRQVRQVFVSVALTAK